MQNAIARVNETAGSADGIIESHDRLIRHLATRFINTGVSLDDVMQEGRIALWLASKTWRADGGAGLWTYARKAVFAAMLRCASSHLGECHASFDEELYADDESASAEATMLVHECLAVLTEEQRFVVRRTMEGESFKSIAAARGKSKDWAHRLFHKAAEILRERAGAS